MHTEKERDPQQTLVPFIEPAAYVAELTQRATGIIPQSNPENGLIFTCLQVKVPLSSSWSKLTLPSPSPSRGGLTDDYAQTSGKSCPQYCRITHGIDVHIEDLKGMFVFAPDTRIKEHPVRIAEGEWTAVSGYIEGTFTEPMPIGNGKTIPPTGKSFRLPMATIGYWKNGVMIEEWLYWDNQAFMKQIGLAP